MKYITPIVLLNFLILQWFTIRLTKNSMKSTNAQNPLDYWDYSKWKSLQLGIVPLTGWWSPFVYIFKRPFFLKITKTTVTRIIKQPEHYNCRCNVAIGFKIIKMEGNAIKEIKLTEASLITYGEGKRLPWPVADTTTTSNPNRSHFERIDTVPKEMRQNAAHQQRINKLWLVRFINWIGKIFP